MHPVPTAMLIVTMILLIRTHSVYTSDTVSIDTVFILIFFSLPDSSVSSKNLVFSGDGCQEGWEGGGACF